MWVSQVSSRSRLLPVSKRMIPVTMDQTAPPTWAHPLTLLFLCIILSEEAAEQETVLARLFLFELYTTWLVQFISYTCFVKLMYIQSMAWQEWAYSNNDTCCEIPRMRNTHLLINQLQYVATRRVFVNCLRGLACIAHQWNFTTNINKTMSLYSISNNDIMSISEHNAYGFTVDYES